MRVLTIARVLAVLCGFAGTPAVSPAFAETAVRFSLDYKIEGPAAPFLVALDKNYYRAEGLDVTIEPAAGSPEPITRLATGAYDMAFGDINALIRMRDANPGTPVKAVFMVYDRPPFAVIGRKSRGVTVPKDLEGRKLGAPPADAAAAHWPIFAKLNDIDIAKVTVENVGIPVRDPMLAAGQVDAITGYSFSSSIDLKDRGVIADDITVLLMADYGVKLYGNAILVNTKFAAEHPDAVKGFLRAFVKGLKETVKAPASAIDSVTKRNDLAKKPLELERLRMALRDNILTPDVKAHGFGGIDTARFEQALEQIGQSYKFKTPPKTADIFDPSFLPPEGERRAN